MGNQLDEMSSIRGLIGDATRDTVLWLQADPSAEERSHVFAMQEQLADLDRIIARRMERGIWRFLNPPPQPHGKNPRSPPLKRKERPASKGRVHKGKTRS